MVFVYSFSITWGIGCLIYVFIALINIHRQDRKKQK